MSSKNIPSLPHTEKLRDMLIRHEGQKLKLYKCTADKFTIGVGRNIEDNGVSKAESDFMLDNDIIRVHEELTMNFGWYYYLSEIRKAAMIDMCFNLGLTRFRKFKKMIEAINNTDYNLAADEMLDSKWARQVGNRAKELAGMMRAG